jgi:hypothetical protein
LPRLPVHLHGDGGDALGIDRRRRARSGDTEAEPALLDDVVFAAHLRWRAFLGLTCDQGGAWLDAISVCPTGMLARAVDPTDPSLSFAERQRLGPQMRALLPQMCRGATSPLVATGVTLLSSRFAEDLGRWAQAPATRPATTVTLLLAPPVGRGGQHGEVERVTGVLAPLTDPHPGILAIALPAQVAARWMARAAIAR